MEREKIIQGGKEVLIKAAAQAIPSYCTGTFLLSATLLDELHVMMNSFWWGSNGNVSKGIKWMSWERICVRKVAVDRDFRNLHLFNIAKVGWRLIM